MSHSPGMVRFVDGSVMHYEYNGTVDLAIPMLWETAEERDAHWRSGEWRECACGLPDEPVTIYSAYGRGFRWPGRACRACRVITDARRPYDEALDDLVDGEPEWVTTVMPPAESTR